MFHFLTSKTKQNKTKTKQNENETPKIIEPLTQSQHGLSESLFEFVLSVCSDSLSWSAFGTFK